MSATDKKLRQIYKAYPTLVDDIQKALKKSKITFTMKGSAEIRAQASQKKIADIICKLPNIKIKHIPILLDIVETKKTTYIRVRGK